MLRQTLLGMVMKMDSKKLFFAFVIIVSFLPGVYALSESDIIFPVAELGNCNSEEECKIYCDNPEKIEACLDFAAKYNLMPKEEIEEARRIMPFLITGTTPGGCKDKEECDLYCEKDENFEDCINFAVKAGFVSDEEAEMAKKTGGKGPGGCKREECDNYCDKEENFLSCLEFAHDNGMINDEDYEMAKKTGGKGPGGCRGKEECDLYCEKNIRECLDFMIDHDLLPEEDKKRLENMGNEEKCMMNCMMDEGLRPGRDCGPNKMDNPGCMDCAGKCFSRRERGRAEGVPEVCLDRGYDKEECISFCEKNPAECGRDEKRENGDFGELDEGHKCMANCMVAAGLRPGEDCGEGSGSPDCDACIDRCFERPQEPELRDQGDSPRSDSGVASGGASSEGPQGESEKEGSNDAAGEQENPIKEESDSNTLLESRTDNRESVEPKTDNQETEESRTENPEPTASVSEITGEVIREGKEFGLFEKVKKFILNLFNF